MQAVFTDFLAPNIARLDKPLGGLLKHYQPFERPIAIILIDTIEKAVRKGIG